MRKLRKLLRIIRLLFDRKPCRGYELVGFDHDGKTVFLREIK